MKSNEQPDFNLNKLPILTLGENKAKKPITRQRLTDFDLKERISLRLDFLSPEVTFNLLKLLTRTAKLYQLQNII